MEWKNRDALWIYAFGVALLLVTAFILWKDRRPEWEKHQAGFKQLVAARLGPDRAAQVQTGLQQIWVKDLNRTDRCVTCHQGVEWSGFDDAPEPYRSHPKGVLEKHPLSLYGCTVCHGGQGFATDARSAHATSIKHWDEPLLASEAAREAGLDDHEALIQINCNVCHRNDAETAGADNINRAKQVFAEVGCDLCHIIDGTGNAIGPELTYVGDHHPEHFDFSRVPQVKTVFGWHVAHFRNPVAVSGETEMKKVEIKDGDARDLALLMMSWRRASLPVKYIPKPPSQ
jgi:cytochrome c2